jgi:hypothetical protein
VKVKPYGIVQCAVYHSFVHCNFCIWKFNVPILLNSSSDIYFGRFVFTIGFLYPTHTTL